MARRKRAAKGKVQRVMLVFVVLAVAAAAAWFACSCLRAAHHTPAPVAEVVPPKPPEKPPEPKHVTLSGQLTATAPARDTQIGIGAPAAVLLRHVEMFEWIEECQARRDGTQECAYRKGWAAPVDSSKFQTAHGRHDNPLRTKNPKSPFADARYVAAEIRLDAVTVDAAIVEQQLKPIEFPVKSTDLPPNMAATFTVRDGMLYAGG